MRLFVLYPPKQLDWSLARDAMITSHRYYANSTGCPSKSVSSSKWHAWFASHYPSRHLSTWQMTAASCPTALDAADVPTCMVPWTLSSYSDRTFAAVGPRLWNSLPAQLRTHFTSHFTCGLFRRQLKGHLFWKAWTRTLWLLICWCHRKTLTYTCWSVYMCVASETQDEMDLMRRHTRDVSNSTTSATDRGTWLIGLHCLSVCLYTADWLAGWLSEWVSEWVELSIPLDTLHVISQFRPYLR